VAQFLSECTSYIWRQVLGSSLEAAVLKSDNSSLAKDCRKEIKGITSKIAKLGRKVRNLHCSISFFE